MKKSVRRKTAPASQRGNSRHGWLLPAALLLLLAAGLCIGLAGRGDLYNETDGQYAAAAHGIVETGNWLVPENNGVPRLNKPPLLAWLLASSFFIGGVGEFTARLPSLLGVVAWVMGVFALGTLWNGAWTGFRAGAVLLTCLGTATLGRIIMPEPWFCAFLTWALVALWLGLRPDAHGGRWAAGFWICCALAALVKGWHGFVLPVCALLLGGLWCRRREQMLRILFFWPGWLAAAAIALPWLLLMEFRFPGFLKYFFLDEALGHVAGSSSTDTSYENVPRTAFFALHIAWFFPWSLAVLGAIARWKSWQWPEGQERLFWVWGMLVVFILLLAGQRQDYYGMMGWSVFALFASWAIWETPSRIAAHLLTGIGLFGLFAAWMFPWWSQWLPTENALLAERATAIRTVAGFDAAVWSGLVEIAFYVFGSFALAGMLAAWFSACSHRAMVFFLWTSAAAVLWLGAVEGMARIAPWFSHAETARWIHRNQPDAIVAYDGDSDTGSSLYFYLGRPVLLLREPERMEFAARVHGVGVQWSILPEELVERWERGDSILLVTERLQVPTWRIRYPRLREVTRHADQVVLRPAGSG